MELVDVIPDYKQLKVINIEEVAFAMIKVLDFHSRGLPLQEFCNLILKNHHRNGYVIPQSELYDIQMIISEGWSWLKREGLIIQNPDMNPNQFHISRKGRAVAKELNLESYKKASQFPESLIHEKIRGSCRLNFFRGAYDTAIFEAFKNVEVLVREATMSPNSLVGVPLMRKAFNPKDGILTDKNLEGGEQQAIADLFAGAMGYCKNPQSHRNVGIEFEEAIELILLASHLIKLVEVRVNTLKAS